MRIMLVVQGLPSGTPATTLTRRPALAKPSLADSRHRAASKTDDVCSGCVDCTEFYLIQFVSQMFPRGEFWETEVLENRILLGERGGARTHDPVIKSHVLYRLSYALVATHLGYREPLSKQNLRHQRSMIRLVPRTG